MFTGCLAAALLVSRAEAAEFGFQLADALLVGGAGLALGVEGGLGGLAGGLLGLAGGPYLLPVFEVVAGGGIVEAGPALVPG